MAVEPRLRQAYVSEVTVRVFQMKLFFSDFLEARRNGDILDLELLV